MNKRSYAIPNLLPFDGVDPADVEGMRYMMGYKIGWGDGQLDPNASESFMQGYADGLGDKISWMLDGNYP